MSDTEGSTPEKQGTDSSASGVDPKLAALLSYLFLLIGGIIFLLIEKDNKYVRFHAAQSIVAGIASIVLSAGVGIVMAILGTVFAATGLFFLFSIFSLIQLVVSLGIFVLWIVLMINAYNGYDKGETFKLPVLGNMAEKLAEQKF